MSIQIGGQPGGGGGVSGAFPVEISMDAVKNLVLADNLKFHVMSNAGAITINIPDEASEDFPIGAEMEFLRETEGTITFLTPGVATLHSRDSLVTINSEHSVGALKKTEADKWILLGDLA